VPIGTPLSWEAKPVAPHDTITGHEWGESHHHVEGYLAAEFEGACGRRGLAVLPRDRGPSGAPAYPTNSNATRRVKIKPTIPRQTLDSSIQALWTPKHQSRMTRRPELPTPHHNVMKPRNKMTASLLRDKLVEDLDVIAIQEPWLSRS
jgi:hypothetical protein